MADWSDKTALITGASSGIGAAAARFLAARGLRVLLTARRAERLQSLAREIGSLSGRVEVFPADLSRQRERVRLFESITASHQVDILINSAGFGWYGYFARMPWDTARQLIAVNIEALAHLTALFLPLMQARGSGHIVNIGSISGGFPNQGIAMYSGSKAFLDAFTSSLYRELRSSGVHASVMRLGPVETEFFDQARRLQNGGAVPAERLAVSVDMVNRALWRLLNHPRRVAYVPGWLRLSRFAEPLLGNLVDLFGPLLLRQAEKNRRD